MRLTLPLPLPSLPATETGQVNAEGMENAILDLATATQNVMDKLDEDDAEVEAQRKKQAEAAAAAADVEDADGDYDLGM